jgi:hypothetical protein
MGYSVIIQISCNTSFLDLVFKLHGFCARCARNGMDDSPRYSCFCKRGFAAIVFFQANVQVLSGA